MATQADGHNINVSFIVHLAKQGTCQSNLQSIWRGSNIIASNALHVETRVTLISLEGKRWHRRDVLLPLCVERDFVSNTFLAQISRRILFAAQMVARALEKVAPDKEYGFILGIA